MLSRLKRALVTSFVGAIGLGWVFAEGIRHFANVFSAPVTNWLMRREYSGLTDRATTQRGFLVQDSLPDLITSIGLLLMGYFLLRWLYYKPLGEGPTEPDSLRGA